MGEFTRVLSTTDLPPGEMRAVTVGGEEVAVANVDGAFCAFSNFCSHEGGPLAEGELDGDIVTCPWHFTRFNIRTGEVVDGVTDDPIPVYPVEVRDGEVWVKPA
jgi:nitrite reductase/ring-hydroxylating ferredoxin subunit